MLSDTELQKRIESSAELSELRDQIAAALASDTENKYSFDPLLIIAIISIMIQVITYCRDKHSTEDLIRDITTVKELPPRRLMRFKRRANVLWREYCIKRGLDTATPNPILPAVYGLGTKVPACAIAELVKLAE